MAVAMFEGAVLLGFLTYLAPLLEAQSASAALTGAVSARYGVGSMAAARMVRRLVGRWTPVRLIVVGGAQTTVAYGLAAAGCSVPALVGVRSAARGRLVVHALHDPVLGHHRDPGHPRHRRRDVRRGPLRRQRPGQHLGRRTRGEELFALGPESFQRRQTDPRSTVTGKGAAALIAPVNTSPSR
ncbi:hypothetical protein AB0C59_31845 [Streptomyces sp. NPDC048664]|uniref:hypothetical protein n=1 Tax=Streptomyces sp. NPDC048664 TaxID=3154505 RepID=UPI0034433002